ncbi:BRASSINOSTEROID INSENSITIVE 1-associated receptor kinase 1 [Eucalyptus grandis]|uniref:BRASSINOSTEROID INSENSITIVE 1-associated receptor kinase 1 n=1 Tax=Eucalyptus grandis TaxID=71139 RepID=UPI00192F1089|nr:BRASSINOSTEROID INSENSITIVE 1-associated receptor kinase 1 [Eucalyptus grandis]
MVFNLRTFSFSSADEDDPTPPRNFSLKELRDATNRFSHGNIVGGGEFGVVYRGRLADGSLVVVKRAVTIDQERKEFFEREMQVASSVSLHPNVLNLRGFCRAKKELLLVYPLMIHNSLASNLGELRDRSTGPLDWTTRKRIALGAARGLAHLHNQGFSAAVIMHERYVQEGTIKNRVEDSVAYDSGSQAYNCYDYVYDDNFIHGVRGFIAPEYSYTGKCTLKNDVFAFGRTLLELVSGQGTWDLFLLRFGKHIILEERTDGGIIKNELKTLIDPELQGKYPEEEAEGLVQLALLCTHDDPSVRPEMSQVIRMLETQLLGQDPSSRSSRSLSEHDSTPFYSFPPSPSSEAAP